MKKISVLAAFFCLLFAASVIFAQNKATNFAGSWELDIAKSKLPERMRVGSMTMNVTQTGKELKVETTANRAPRPEGDKPAGDANGAGMRPGGGMGRGGMMGGGNGAITYSLDGKETTVESDASAGMPASARVVLKAETEKDGKLKLLSSRSFETQMGSMTVKTTETWELVDGGKSLKVTRDTETPRGSQIAEMYFTKKDSTSVSGSGSTEVHRGEVKSSTDVSLSGTSQTPKQISGGVLNGKASKLVLPDYPPAARAVKASGAVNVQVTIDEQGNIVSASAVSGHPLLRAAAVEAARNSVFAPTMLQGVPVRVTGVIVYNFVP